MDRPKKPTLSDVAQLANVSKTTVSVVMTGRGRVDPKTKDRVERAARELGYIPSAAARALREPESNARLMGLVFQEIPSGASKRDAKTTWERAFYALIVDLDKHNISTVVVPRMESEMLRRMHVDAIAAVVTEPTDIPLPEAAPPGVPVVLFGHLNPAEEPAGFAAVIDTNYEELIRGAMDHLFEQGSVAPAFVLSPHPLSPQVIYEHAYRKWCAERRIEPHYVCMGDVRIAAREVIGAGADAILLCGDDSLPDLEAVMSVIVTSGHRIPETFLLISLTESGREATMIPSVTTVVNPGRAAGILAAKAMVAGIRTGTFESHALKHSLVLRESTNRAPVTC